MLCDRIKKLRETTGLSARKFAQEFGIKYTTYYGYETGSREPGSDFLIKLAKYFNVTTDYILGIEDETKKTSASLENNAEENEEDDSKLLLLKELDNLTQEDRKNLLDYVRFLASKRNSTED